MADRGRGREFNHHKAALQLQAYGGDRKKELIVDWRLPVRRTLSGILPGIARVLGWVERAEVDDIREDVSRWRGPGPGHEGWGSDGHQVGAGGPGPDGLALPV